MEKTCEVVNRVEQKKCGSQLFVRDKCGSQLRGMDKCGKLQIGWRDHWVKGNEWCYR